MANFKISFDITNKNEGGYSNSPNDRGLETYRGISRKNWPNWEGWKIIDQYKPVVVIRAFNNTLSGNSTLQSLVQAFYKTNFWDVNKLDQIDDHQIANTVYDFGVNSGVVKAAKTLQSVLGITADGIIGSQTLQAVNESDAKETYARYNEARKSFYTAISENPGQSVFLHSWLSRLVPYNEKGQS